MNAGKDSRIINSISGRLSLRAPQRESLEALANAIEITGKIVLGFLKGF